VLTNTALPAVACCNIQERLSKAAEHSQVVQDDPAAAARLRLALSAALQSANLVAPSSKAAKAAKSGPLQGLDAAGVAAYVDQTLQAFVAAAQGGGQRAASNGAANGVHSGSEDDQDKDADAADDGQALQQLEQLVAGLRLPAADAATLHKALSFLAAVAFISLPQGFEPTAPAAAAPPPGSSKKKPKKGKQAVAAEAAASPAAAALQLAASIQPQPSAQLRHAAGARLVGLLHSLQHKPVAQDVLDAAAAQARAAHKQQADGASSGDAAAGQPASKKQRAAQQAAQEAAAGAARAAAAKAAEALTVQLLELVITCPQLGPGVSVTADEDIAEMVEQLQQLGAVVAQNAPQLPPGAPGSQQQQQQQLAARQRVVLQLVHQLQLQLLSGGLSAEAAGSVVDDLEMSVLRGLGLGEELLEQLRAADAAARLKMAGAADSGSSEKQQDEGSEGSDADGGSSDEDEGAPAWQDVLLDLLLSLLSNSSSGEGGASSGRGGGGSSSMSVPSVPLREACEAVFKAFAEDMTAQGGWVFAWGWRAVLGLCTASPACMRS
jgi:hypothetical protein